MLSSILNELVSPTTQSTVTAPPSSGWVNGPKSVTRTPPTASATAQATWMPSRSRQSRVFQSSTSPMNMITLDKARISQSEPERSMTPLAVASQRLGKAGRSPAAHDQNAEPENADRRQPDRHAASQRSRLAMALVPAGPVDEPQPGGEVSHEQTKCRARDERGDDQAACHRGQHEHLVRAHRLVDSRLGV